MNSDEHEAMELQETQRRIFENRWPGLWQKLTGAPREHQISSTTGTPETTLIIDELHLTSSYDRSAEARLQAELIPPGASQAWVYGVALGDLPRELLRREALTRLVVVILNPEITATSLSQFDHSDWLGDPRVELVLGCDESGVHKPFAVAPALLRLCSEGSLALRDELLLRLAAPLQMRQHRRLDSELSARVESIRSYLEMDGDVAELFGTRPKSRAVVVAAGPTLSDWFDWLSTRREELLVIAVNTSLAPLQMRGIDPDVVVIVEHRSGALTHIEAADTSRDRLGETTLVYAPVVSKEVLDLWHGPRLATYLAGQGYRVPREELPHSDLFCSGTVTHAAVDLAVKMGAQEVVLLGVDFCFPGQQSHVEGAVFRRNLSDQHHTSFVLDGLGGRTPTQTNMIGYLRDLEEYVARHDEVRFVKGGREGAAIEGVCWLDDERGGDGDDGGEC